MSGSQHHPAEHEHTDAWHTHLVVDGVPQHEHGSKINVKVVWISFLFTVVFVVGTILVAGRYFIAESTKARIASIETTVLAEEYWTDKQAADARLSGFGWSSADAAKAGQVSIPLEQARAKVMESYNKK
jgi:hypothetical protein